MSKILKFSVLVSGIAMAGCQTTMHEPSEKFGDAIRQNIAVQTVPPTAEQKQNTYIRPDSQRMAGARERYKQDQVEEPEDLRTIE